MKKWMKFYLIMSVLLVTVFSAATASAKNIATAVLEKAQDGNNVTVAIDLSESRTEQITSLRFQLLAAVEEIRDTELKFDENSVSFTFADGIKGIKGVKTDAAVRYAADVTDYVIDVVISGKENIFRNSIDEPLTIGTLSLPEGEYYAEVGLLAYDDGSEESENAAVAEEVVDVEAVRADADTVSVLEYVESAGVEVMRVDLKASEKMEIGEKTPEITPEPAPSVPTPAPSVPTPTPVPSVPTPAPQTPVPQTPTAPTTAPTISADLVAEAGGSEETEAKPAEKPPLQPAEPRKNGMSAPRLVLRPLTGTRKISFSWTEVKGAKGYQIYKYDEKTGEYKKYKNVKGNSFIGKFSFGQTYRFKLRAYKKKSGSNVYGAFSAEKEVTASSFNKTKKPSFRVTTPEKGRKLSFTWKQQPGADGYQILRYMPETKTYKVVKTVKGGDKLTVRTIKYKYVSNYRFKMRAFAYDDHGNKVLGALSTAVKFTTPPARVSGMKAESSKTAAVRISWKKVKGADGYLVYRSDPGAGDEMKQIARVKGSVRSYTDEGLDSGAQYSYQVAAYKNASSGKRSVGRKSAAGSVEVK